MWCGLYYHLFIAALRFSYKGGILMNDEQFIQALKEQGIELNEKQIAQFSRYFELLVEWNEKMNLTAITDAAICLFETFL